jgi:hypothetical protein
MKRLWTNSRIRNWFLGARHQVRAWAAAVQKSAAPLLATLLSLTSLFAYLPHYRSALEKIQSSQDVFLAAGTPNPKTHEKPE